MSVIIGSASRAQNAYEFVRDLKNKLEQLGDPIGYESISVAFSDSESEVLSHFARGSQLFFSTDTVSVQDVGNGFSDVSVGLNFSSAQLPDGSSVALGGSGDYVPMSLLLHHVPTVNLSDIDSSTIFQDVSSVELNSDSSSSQMYTSLESISSKLSQVSGEEGGISSLSATLGSGDAISVEISSTGRVSYSETLADGSTVRAGGSAGQEWSGWSQDFTVSGDQSHLEVDSSGNANFSVTDASGAEILSSALVENYMDSGNARHSWSNEDSSGWRLLASDGSVVASDIRVNSQSVDGEVRHEWLNEDGSQGWEVLDADGVRQTWDESRVTDDGGMYEAWSTSSSESGWRISSAEGEPQLWDFFYLDNGKPAHSWQNSSSDTGWEILETNGDRKFWEVVSSSVEGMLAKSWKYEDGSHGELTMTAEGGWSHWNLKHVQDDGGWLLSVGFEDGSRNEEFYDADGALVGTAEVEVDFDGSGRTRNTWDNAGGSGWETWVEGAEYEDTWDYVVITPDGGTDRIWLHDNGDRGREVKDSEGNVVESESFSVSGSDNNSGVTTNTWDGNNTNQSSNESSAQTDSSEDASSGSDSSASGSSTARADAGSSGSASGGQPGAYPAQYWVDEAGRDNFIEFDANGGRLFWDFYETDDDGNVQHSWNLQSGSRGEVRLDAQGDRVEWSEVLVDYDGFGSIRQDASTADGGYVLTYTSAEGVLQEEREMVLDAQGGGHTIHWRQGSGNHGWTKYDSAGEQLSWGMTSVNMAQSGGRMVTSGNREGDNSVTMFDQDDNMLYEMREDTNYEGSENTYRSWVRADGSSYWQVVTPEGERVQWEDISVNPINNTSEREWFFGDNDRGHVTLSESGESITWLTFSQAEAPAEGIKKSWYVSDSENGWEILDTSGTALTWEYVDTDASGRSVRHWKNADGDNGTAWLDEGGAWQFFDIYDTGLDAAGTGLRVWDLPNGDRGHAIVDAEGRFFSWDETQYSDGFILRSVGDVITGYVESRTDPDGVLIREDHYDMSSGSERVLHTWVLADGTQGSEWVQKDSRLSSYDPSGSSQTAQGLRFESWEHDDGDYGYRLFYADGSLHSSRVFDEDVIDPEGIYVEGSDYYEWRDADGSHGWKVMTEEGVVYRSDTFTTNFDGQGSVLRNTLFVDGTYKANVYDADGQLMSSDYFTPDFEGRGLTRVTWELSSGSAGWFDMDLDGVIQYWDRIDVSYNEEGDSLHDWNLESGDRGWILSDADSGEQRTWNYYDFADDGSGLVSHYWRTAEDKWGYNIRNQDGREVGYERIERDEWGDLIKSWLNLEGDRGWAKVDSVDDLEHQWWDYIDVNANADGDAYHSWEHADGDKGWMWLDADDGSAKTWDVYQADASGGSQQWFTDENNRGSAEIDSDGVWSTWSTWSATENANEFRHEWKDGNGNRGFWLYDGNGNVTEYDFIDQNDNHFVDDDASTLDGHISSWDELPTAPPSDVL